MDLNSLTIHQLFLSIPTGTPTDAKISLLSHGCQSARFPGSFITVPAAGMPCGWCQESYAKGSLGLFSCPLNPTSGKLLSFLLWLRSLPSTNGIKMPFCPPLRAFLCLPSKAGTTTDTGATPADVYEMEKIPSPSLCLCLLHCFHGGVSIPLHPKLYGDNG